MTEDVTSSQGGVDPLIQAEQKTAAAEMRAAGRGQAATKQAVGEELSEAFNPFAADKETQFKALKERRQQVHIRKEKPAEEGLLIEAASDAYEAAERLAEENPELDAKVLDELRRQLEGKAEGAEAEEVLQTVLETYSDPSLADEALDYLIGTGSSRLRERARKAKEFLNEKDGSRVRAGRNMGPESRAYAEAGLGTAEDLRNLYRDITNNPRERNELFQELSARFPYLQMKDVIQFLMHSLGADLRAKGPSISRGELYRLMTESRVLQSILGVYGFFHQRRRLIANAFAQSGLELTDELAFEKLAQEFIDLVEERYPSSSHIFKAASKLGIDRNTLAQIIIFQQYRDAVREVAPRIYRSLQHRFNLLMALIEALEELEEEWEEEEEEREEEEEEEEEER